MCCFLTGGGDSAALGDQEARESVLWDAEEGAWLDCSLITRSKNLEVYPSNITPFWPQCYFWPGVERQCSV